MAFLVMNRDADSARDRLLDTFWPEADPDRARDSLSVALWSIRRCLRTAGADVDTFLVATKTVVRWIADTTLDATQFADLAAREDPSASQEALQLYRGDFLEGDYDNWAVAERERLAALYETVLARVVRTSRDTEAAQRFIARNPYDEEAYAAIIEAELAAGRRSSAASWVERCRKALSEVGEKPSTSFEARFGNIVHIEPFVPDELTLPFTGREAELATLAARIADGVKRHGSLTLVYGEAGIGKSTLLDRAAQLATENGLRVIVARCSSEIPSTFGPWQELFTALGAGDFEAFVRAHAGDLALAVGQAIIARLSEPSVVIADDVHELTGEALDIFVALSQTAMRDHAIVAGARPEGMALLRSRLVDVSFEELSIGRLGRDDLKWALAQSLGTDQPEVLDVLYDRTGGHPLFFTGLLNSLVNAGALSRDGHRWQLTKPIKTDMEMPDTVRRFIETRLRARGDVPRAIAAALAIEPAANSEDLAWVLGFDESATLDGLDDLLSLGLITQPPSGAQFAFAHDLIREVSAEALNAGRRASLHRAFAQRLKTSGQLQASLSLARHLEAAGEPLPAAQSYLKSAREAFELNAAQDAIDRCDAGIRQAEMLERSGARDAVLAELHRTAARAAMAYGSADDAIRRARDAVTYAGSNEDLRESTLAVLDLAVIEGLAFHVGEQKSDSAAAAQSARRCHDEALEAQALVQGASAARELGLREEALPAGKSAYEFAIKCGRSDVAVTALEEMLRAQTTWWLFNDAVETARAGLDVARRVAPTAEAAFLHARGALWYLLERFDEAEVELRTALRITDEIAARPQDARLAPLHPQPYLQFGCHYLACKIAIAQRHWDRALDAADRAAALTNVAKLPRHSQALAMVRIDALLQRGLRGEVETTENLGRTLGDSTLAQGLIGWSDCAELARARIAAKLHTPDAGTRLRRVVDTLEENAHRALLDSDVAFARLREAASEADEGVVERRVAARWNYYRSRRIASAGASWGGPVTHPGTI